MARAEPVHHDHRLVAHDPRVVAAGQRGHVAGAGDELGAVVHPDGQPAAELGVTKPSLHYHFASKAALGRALMTRYAKAFSTALAGIDEDILDSVTKLRRYAKLYTDVLRGHRMCLCGMLAAEHTTLPRDLQDEVTRFFDANEAWVSSVLAQGRRVGELAFDGAPRDMARLFVGSLEGAMLIARSYGDVSRLESAAQHLLGKLRSTERGARSSRCPRRPARVRAAR